MVGSVIACSIGGFVQVRPASQAILVLAAPSAMCFFCPGLKELLPIPLPPPPLLPAPQLAFLGFSSQAAVQGLGPIECLQKHLADPGHNNSERGPKPGRMLLLVLACTPQFWAGGLPSCTALGAQPACLPAQPQPLTLPPQSSPLPWATRRPWL